MSSYVDALHATCLPPLAVVVWIKHFLVFVREGYKHFLVHWVFSVRGFHLDVTEFNGELCKFGTFLKVRMFRRSKPDTFSTLLAVVTLAILPLGKWLFPTGKQFFMCDRSAQRKISCGKFPWLRQKEQKNCP